MRKVWYNIVLIDKRDGCEQVVAKVKSKGLANLMYNHMLEIYKNTVYLVHVE